MGVAFGNSALYVSATESIGESMTYNKMILVFGEQRERERGRKIKVFSMVLRRKPLGLLQLCSFHASPIRNNSQQLQSAMPFPKLNKVNGFGFIEYHKCSITLANNTECFMINHTRQCLILNTESPTEALIHKLELMS